MKKGGIKPKKRVTTQSFGESDMSSAEEID